MKVGKEERQAQLSGQGDEETAFSVAAGFPQLRRRHSIGSSLEKARVLIHRAVVYSYAATPEDELTDLRAAAQLIVRGRANQRSR